ncbi:MAG: SGNH/GDSL hydrolase family protein [Clostridia bacterium]|nr:SGNH/GDSL hydrolase family protein [Clostridia bacterium]
MKKLIVILLAITCLLLVGCNKDTADTPDVTTTAGGDEACEHVWGETKITVEPTCTSDGEGERTCTLCGETELVEVETKGHTVPNNIYTDNPTFMLTGRQQGDCSVCGKNIRSAAPTLVAKYNTVSANLTNVTNVYFNGYWADAQSGGAKAAYTNMLGSEVVAKVTGASKVTYSFAISDATKSAVVAYSLDGKAWTRWDLKSSTTLTVAVPAEETVVRVMFVETNIDLAQSGAGLYLKSVAADKGTVVPCLKDGPVVLLVSDRVEKMESDVMTLTAENLGYTNWRITREGLGYVSFTDILEAYASAQGKTTVDPEFILLDIGANDDSVSTVDFRAKLVAVIDALIEAYPETDINLVEPANGAKVGQLEAMTETYGCVEMLDSDTWKALAAEDAYKKLSEIIVAKYGETMFFDGYYASYNDPADATIPTDKKEDDSYGGLIELT